MFLVRGEEEGRAGKGREGGKKRGEKNPESDKGEERLRKGNQRRKKP